jgi:PleD family two-component response regulator
MALAYLRTHVPRLVILDVMMPGIDGMEVLRLMREDRRTANVPVVMYSAISDPEYVRFAKSRGATDFWIKSQIDFAKLHDLVSPYLDDPVVGNSN